MSMNKHSPNPALTATCTICLSITFLRPEKIKMPQITTERQNKKSNLRLSLGEISSPGVCLKRQKLSDIGKTETTERQYEKANPLPIIPEITLARLPPQVARTWTQAQKRNKEQTNGESERV